MEPDWVEHASKALSEMSRRIERAIFTGEVPPTTLPWEPKAGEPCPYCWGQGKDDSGPGPWTCDECNATGYLGVGFEPKREFIVSASAYGNEVYQRYKDPFR